MSSTEGTPINPVAEFFLAPFRLRTYANLLYLWLAFPLGLFYFVTLITGFSLGLGLLIVWVGILVLLVVLLFVWLLGGFERLLAQGLLGARIPRRPLPAVGEVGVMRWLGAVLRSPALYKSVLFLGLKFPIGLAGWVFSLVGLSLSLGLALTPIVYAFDLGDIDWDFWAPQSFGESLPLVLVGAAVFLVTLNAQNLLCVLWRGMAEALLGSEEEVVVPPAPVTGGEEMTPATA